jgi:hypothetical protein
VKRLVAIFLLASLWLGHATLVQAAESLSIDSLSWISGDWRGPEEGGVLEEHYSSLDGDSILGTSRIVSKGRSIHLEWILFEQSADGTFQTVSLPHVHKTYRFKLIRHQNQTWVFETRVRVETTAGRAKEAAFEVQRLTLTRDTQDSMTLKLEKQQDGKPWSADFHLTRVTAK